MSEPVTFSAKVRTFVLDGRVLDAAVYEGEAEVSGAVDFVGALTKSIVLPLTVVIDVGLADGRGWAVIEFNVEPRVPFRDQSTVHKVTKELHSAN